MDFGMNGNENGVSFRQVSFRLYRAGWVSGKDMEGGGGRLECGELHTGAGLGLARGRRWKGQGVWKEVVSGHVRSTSPRGVGSIIGTGPNSEG